MRGAGEQPGWSQRLIMALGSRQANGQPLSPETRLEQLKMLIESQRMPMPYSFPVLVGLFALCFVDSIAWHWLAIPVALIFVANWLNRKNMDAFAVADPGPEDVSRWERRSILITVFFALSTGSIAIFFWVPDDPVKQAYVLTALIISLAPVALITSCSMPSFYAATMPIVLIAAARLFLSGEILPIALGGVLLIFAVLLSQLTTRLNGIMMHSITLREDKSGLIEQLFKAKRDSDAARARAEEANRAKSHFLANMSHELRTPLNAIIGFSEVMSSEIFGKHAVPTYKEYANDINRSGQHLLGLINDVLDLSRIEAGRFQITEEEVDIAQLADDCRRILEIRAQGQRVTIVEEYEPNLPIFYGDARAMRQTWINLLTNAIKFSPPGSEVKMFARMEPNGEMRFGVHDNGPGIAESEIDKVLHAFTQGASGLAQPGKGSGLGLSIVKGLLAVHGGRFELKSKLGEGTQAECVLPPQRLRQNVSMAKRAS
ncbi:HAMP domain-containing sensor histidine kinase [Parvibaculum sp.]|uniref:sensor histidine kinase n=1 Tax=Parvibaculum sp. TaxID=2024848 RepID=UPI001D5891FE|nr:HAMP domain-containing sensor histidine kinase [Parvibaculum sp.]MBX3490813.1 HAMP domain-containing histidine kinase [Parvibaculum sp.]MCW5728717.1 HAMP domain-containing histidine kinase [Parvibaculum sp.]